MVWEKINRFCKVGLTEKNKKAPLFIMIMLILLILAECSDRAPEVSGIEITQQDSDNVRKLDV